MTVSKGLWNGTDLDEVETCDEVVRIVFMRFGHRLSDSFQSSQMNDRIELILNYDKMVEYTVESNLFKYRFQVMFVTDITPDERYRFAS